VETDATVEIRKERGFPPWLEKPRQRRSGFSQFPQAQQSSSTQNLTRRPESNLLQQKTGRAGVDSPGGGAKSKDQKGPIKLTEPRPKSQQPIP